MRRFSLVACGQGLQGRGCRQSLGIERGCGALGQRYPSSPDCCCLRGLDIVLVLKLTVDRLQGVLV